MERLNDNEVKEIANMQRKIDTYESFICTVFSIIKSKRTDLNFLLFSGMHLTEEMNRIWLFVKQTIKDNEGKKDSEATKVVP